MAVFFPFPCASLECLAAELQAAFSFFQQLAFHHHLRCNSGVIRAGHPERVDPLHSIPPDHDVMESMLKGMSHVECSGYVRWRYNDRKIRTFRIYFAAKISAF